MTEAVQLVCDYGFKEFGLIKITAHIFSFNTGSARVLEKAGFQLAALLQRSKKDWSKLF